MATPEGRGHPEPGTEATLAERITRESALFDERTQVRLREYPTSYEELANERAAREPLERREGALHGQEVHVFGVIHTPETFVFHREELERSVAQSGVIGLEGAPEISGIYRPEFLEAVRTRLRERNMSEEEITHFLVGNIFENPFDQFFHELEQLAKKYQKPVVIIDPDSGVGALQELTNSWVEGGQSTLRHEAAKTENTLALFGGLAGIGGFGLVAWSFFDDLRQRRNPAPIDRRKLLGVGLFTAGSWAAGAGHQLPEMWPQLSYDILDYRNVSIVRGMDQLAQHRQFEGPITFFYGRGHTHAIETYLRDSGIRDFKYGLYERFRRLRAPEIHGYQYEGQEGRYEWRPFVNEEVQ